MTLLVGGTHTTGNTLHLLFANLARRPGALRRVITEVDERLPPLRPGRASYGLTGLEEKPDFVNAAILETHRKDPLATFNMPKTVPNQGAEIAGHWVPGETQVSMNIHSFHHNPNVWGLDHDVYDPARWYDDRAKDLREYLIPFSVGSRACVGQNLANANILKMMTTLFKCYEFEFLNADEELKVVSHGDLDLRTPILVKCKMRGLAYEARELC